MGGETLSPHNEEQRNKLVELLGKTQLELSEVVLTSQQNIKLRPQPEIELRPIRGSEEEDDIEYDTPPLRLSVAPELPLKVGSISEGGEAEVLYDDLPSPLSHPVSVEYPEKYEEKSSHKLKPILFQRRSISTRRKQPIVPATTPTTSTNIKPIECPKTFDSSTTPVSSVPVNRSENTSIDHMPRGPLKPSTHDRKATSPSVQQKNGKYKQLQEKDGRFREKIGWCLWYSWYTHIVANITNI